MMNMFSFVDSSLAAELCGAHMANTRKRMCSISPAEFNKGAALHFKRAAQTLRLYDDGSWPMPKPVPPKSDEEIIELMNRRPSASLMVE
jgi:hypothetical protein